MKRALITSATAALVFLASIGAGRAAAQAAGAPAAAAQAAPAPHMPDGRPDLSGVWWPGRDVPLAPLGSTPPARRPATATPAAPRRRPASFASLYQPWAMEKARTLG